jgi:nicotinamide riboside transporter PnuC
LSARLLVVSLVLVLANSLIVMPFTEGRTGLQAVQNVSNALVGSCVVASGVIGLFAVVARRERSWVVGVAILVLAVVMFLMVQDLASRG